MDTDTTEQMESSPAVAQKPDSSPMIPKSRLDEVISARNELQQQLEQFTKAEQERQAQAKAAEEERLAKQAEWKELAEKRAAELEQLKKYQEQATRQQEVLEQYYSAEAANIPDAVKELVEKLPITDRLDWLSKNKDSLRQTTVPNIDGTAKSSGGSKMTDADKQELAARLGVDARYLP